MNHNNCTVGVQLSKEAGGGLFKITLSEKFFNGQDILKTADGSRVRVIGDIFESNTRWYHKVLNYLTFGKYFVRGYVYNCKIVKSIK